MGEPIRVLHILQRMEAGGTQALLMNIYRKIDRTKVQFDFLVVYKEKQFYDDEIEKMGGHVYKLSFREDLNLPKFQKDLAVFFAQHHEYKIVHCHAYTIGYFCLKAAKKAGIPVRIAHSHNNETVHDIKYLPNTGNYIKYNNPHKVSLYVASGIPIIIWEEAAMAEIIKKYNIGICVESLENIEKTLSEISEEQYLIMKKNVKMLSEKVKEGWFLKQALKKV